MTLRVREARSIGAFVQSAADEGYLAGRVLDYGCGRQPYREIVEAVGEYLPFDRADFPGSVTGGDIGHLPVSVDSVLCTQVVQYVPDVPLLLARCASRLRAGGTLAAPRASGHLVLTYPTHWPEVEGDDLWRFTKAGMEHLLAAARFTLIVHEPREIVATTLDGEDLVAGYGVIARA